MDNIDSATNGNTADSSNAGGPPPLDAPSAALPNTSNQPQNKVTSNIGTSHGSIYTAEKMEFHEVDGKEVAKEFTDALDKVKPYNFPGSSARNRSYFKFDDIWRIREERQAEIAELFIADQSEIDCLRTLINQKRILILTGELRLGKRTTAIYLAHSIMKPAAALADEQDAQPKPLEIWVVPAMNCNVVINVAEIYKNGEAPASRFVIFEDAFSAGNEDLKGFLRQFNESSLKEFANQLTAPNSYLVFY